MGFWGLMNGWIWVVSLVLFDCCLLWCLGFQVVVVGHKSLFSVCVCGFDLLVCLLGCLLSLLVCAVDISGSFAPSR